MAAHPRSRFTETDMLAEHWWRMQQQKDAPAVTVTAQPKAPGAGELIAAAIREELRLNGYSEDVRWW